MTWSFAAVVLFSFTVLTLFGWQVNTTRHLAQDGRQAHDSLCVLKFDIGQRIKDSTTFLEEHPQGLAGIPAATIRTSIRNQQATFDALAALEC